MVKIIFDKNSALASVRAECEELIAGQFHSQGPKIH